MEQAEITIKAENAEGIRLHFLSKMRVIKKLREILLHMKPKEGGGRWESRLREFENSPGVKIFPVNRKYRTPAEIMAELRKMAEN